MRSDVDYAMLTKVYGAAPENKTRYSPLGQARSRKRLRQNSRGGLVALQTSRAAGISDTVSSASTAGPA
jgi:hypothetical protein